MNASPTPANNRSLSEILTEMKHELQEFTQTRIELVRAELHEKAKVIKAAFPLIAVAMLLLTVAFVLFSFALVGLVVVAFDGNPYRWFIAFLVISLLWGICGGIVGLIAKHQLNAKGIVPRKIIHVLNNDKAWLQREARNIL